MTFSPKNRRLCALLVSRSPASHDAAASADTEFRRKLAVHLISTFLNLRPGARGKVQLRSMLRRPFWVDTLGAWSHRTGIDHRRQCLCILVILQEYRRRTVSKASMLANKAYASSLSFAGYSAQFKSERRSMRSQWKRQRFRAGLDRKKYSPTGGSHGEDLVVPLAGLTTLCFKVGA